MGSSSFVKRRKDAIVRYQTTITRLKEHMKTDQSGLNPCTLAIEIEGYRDQIAKLKNDVNDHLDLLDAIREIIREEMKKG